MKGNSNMRMCITYTLKKKRGRGNKGHCSPDLMKRTEFCSCPYCVYIQKKLNRENPLYSDNSWYPDVLDELIMFTVPKIHAQPSKHMVSTQHMTHTVPRGSYFGLRSSCADWEEILIPERVGVCFRSRPSYEGLGMCKWRMRN